MRGCANFPARDLFMADTPLIEQAKQRAAVYGLDPALVCAVCEQESEWDTYAIRFEPAFEKKYIHPALPQAPTTEEIAKAMSFGLMQVMGEVARERGFKGKFLSSLCDPDIGLHVGCEYLKHIMDNHGGDVAASLQRWNGGGNPNYAAEVMARMGKYR
jgi:soluble lytic murein transglycosylase-like protein